MDHFYFLRDAKLIRVKNIPLLFGYEAVLLEIKVNIGQAVLTICTKCDSFQVSQTCLKAEADWDRLFDIDFSKIFDVNELEYLRVFKVLHDLKDTDNIYRGQRLLLT